ncbi:carbohydrate ABC transporter permease [Anaerolineales bacterium]
MSDLSLSIKPGADKQALAARERRNQLRRKSFLNLLRGVLILLVVIIFTFPFVWMALASFQNHIDIISPDLSFTPTMRNYDTVFSQHNFLQFMRNSFVVGLFSTAFSLLLGLPAAYAIARFHFNWLGIILLTARIVPGITYLVPWFILFNSIGLNGSFTALILSHMLISMPFVVWVMVPFFEGLPIEIEEAARIDGASMVGTFIRIVLPLAVPAIATAAIMSFIFSWNNFMFSLVLSGDDTRTLPVAIFNFISYASVDWGGLMAAAVIITLPVVIVTIFMQRYIVSGLTAGASKG